MEKEKGECLGSPVLCASKRQMKEEKVIAKSLRQRTTQKKMVQSQVQVEEDYFTKKSTERGKKWWKKFDRRFFQKIAEQDLQDYQQKTCTEEVLKVIQAPTSPLSNYDEQILKSQMPGLFDRDTIRVLYKQNEAQGNQRLKYTLAVYQIDQQSDRQQLEQTPLQYKVTRFCDGMPASKPAPEEQKIKTSAFLRCVSSSISEQFIEKALQHHITNRGLDKSIETEISNWQRTLYDQNQGNLQIFAELQGKVQQEEQLSQEKDNYLYKLLLERTTGSEDQMGKTPQSVKTIAPREEPTGQQLKELEKQQILRIKKYLRWSDTLKYIQYGHADKVQDYLENILQLMGFNDNPGKIKTTKHQKMKTAFQTDCKVCFCTENEDKNRVVYCDRCNTSFHQSCYGIEQIDKDLPFFCDACLYVKEFQAESKNKGKKLKKMCCQICFRSNFPMKNFDGHFYHVTCLFMFNLCQLKDFKLCLRQDISHQIVQEKVIESQLEQSYCNGCTKSTGSQIGMKVNCMVDNCGKSYHPICAYLHGCMFDIQKEGTDLKVGVVCSEHVEERDQANQVYLRRFFSDYKGTSNFSEQQFRVHYQKQIAERDKSIQEKQQLRSPLSANPQQYAQIYLTPARTLQKNKLMQVRMASKQEQRQSKQPPLVKTQSLKTNSKTTPSVKKTTSSGNNPHVSPSPQTNLHPIRELNTISTSPLGKQIEVERCNQKESGDMESMRLMGIYTQSQGQNSSTSQTGSIELQSLSASKRQRKSTKKRTEQPETVQIG